MRGLGFLATALLALVWAACGGGSRDPVARYLDAVEVEQERFLEIREAIAKAVADVEPERPDEGWTIAAESLLFEGAEYSKVAADLEAIEAPAGLKDAHARLIDSVETSSRMTAEFAANLRGMDSGQLATVSSLMSRLGQKARADRTRWRSAVIAAAIDAGVEIPAWVDEVGATA